MSAEPTLVTVDFTEDFNAIIKKFKRDDVLVGIPEVDSTRKGDEPINNATLLALCNFGSPANNIPAWPVMAIGIGKAQDAIADAFAEGARKALSKGIAALSPAYNKAGSLAAFSIKNVINEQEDVPSDKPSPATLAIRKARGFKGTKYWIQTGQMRNAITWVVKGEE